jgi:hypothetical protein
LVRLAVARGATGAVDGVAEAVESLTDRNSRWRAVEHAAEAATAAGHLDQAMAIACLIAMRGAKARALSAVARACAAAGEVERAESIVSMITDERAKGEALLAVVRARPTVDARGLAEVLMLIDWHVALPEVVRAVPGAFEEILDELDRVYSADVLGGVEQE